MLEGRAPAQGEASVFDDDEATTCVCAIATDRRMANSDGFLFSFLRFACIHGLDDYQRFSLAVRIKPLVTI